MVHDFPDKDFVGTVGIPLGIRVDAAAEPYQIVVISWSHEIVDDVPLPGRRSGSVSLKPLCSGIDFTSIQSGEHPHRVSVAGGRETNRVEAVRRAAQDIEGERSLNGMKFAQTACSLVD